MACWIASRSATWASRKRDRSPVRARSVASLSCRPASITRSTTPAWPRASWFKAHAVTGGLRSAATNAPSCFLPSALSRFARELRAAVNSLGVTP
jgi:hypothetical protein